MPKQKTEQRSAPESSNGESCSEQLTAYIRSGKSGIYLTTFEEVRAEAEMLKIIPFLNSVKKNPKDKDWDFYIWSCTKGITKLTMPGGGKPGKIDETENPMEMLETWMTKCPERAILLAQDFHGFLGGTGMDPDPILVRKLKEALMAGKQLNKVFIICGAKFNLPVELHKEMAQVEFKLPGKEQLGVVLDAIADGAGLHLDDEERDAVLDAASGLTTSEAEDAFAMSVVKRENLCADIVAAEKMQTVRKNGILEIVDTALTLDDMGGLDLYKEHLWSLRNCFSKEARDYGLPSPRPVICCGQAGTGKSMSAIACKNVFNLPLLRLEAGRLFGSLVGQSEENWRIAFGTAKAVAPAIVWVDEAEGLFSGLGSSGRTDGGTTNRVIKAILHDMQFNSDGLFFVFTSNDIDQFPDPLIDRCDVWSFELPTRKEREAIWKIHIEKRHRKAKAFDIPRLAAQTDGYSGRQIEQVFIKAMTSSFNDGAREPNDEDVERALTFFVPTSVTMNDAIERRRMRLKNRARPASSQDTEIAKGGRKLA